MKQLIKTTLLSGLAVMAMGCSMKGMMIEERVSPLGFDETVNKVITNAEAAGWVIPMKSKGNPSAIHKSIKKHLGKEILPVKVIKLCNAEYAYKILADDDARYASVMMPCSISVYQKSDGKTYVANMKAGRMGWMMGGTVADVMDGPVSGDQAKILGFLDTK
ncbi:MAG: DUF302 domain-containing protein [Pseudomonadota bacterium]